MSWHWTNDARRSCHRCGHPVPAHSGECSVPAELALFKRVLTRLEGNPAKRDLVKRLQYFLAWFGRP